MHQPFTQEKPHKGNPSKYGEKKGDWQFALFSGLNGGLMHTDFNDGSMRFS